MKVSKNSKYQTHKKSIKLTKRVSNSRKTQTTEMARQVPASMCPGDPFAFLTSIVAKHQKIKKLKGDPLGNFF